MAKYGPSSAQDRTWEATISVAVADDGQAAQRLPRNQTAVVRHQSSHQQFNRGLEKPEKIHNPPPHYFVL
jgi:hypothetical protein